MSLIAGFANQIVSLQRRESGDEFSGYTYADPEQIRARYEPNYGLRRTITGDSTEVESLVLTEEAVALGDLIEGSEVRRIETIVDKGGTILGYQVYL